MNPLAAIHVKKKQLGLDDDTARDLYQRVTGERSLRAMNDRQRLAVVAEMDRQGAAQAPLNGSRKRLQGPYAKKLQALWIAGWNLGLIRNRDDAALLAFVKSRTGVDDTRFLINAADARKAVEALKDWLARDGGVDWTGQVDGLADDRLRVAWAQWRVIVPGATFVGNLSGFRRHLAQLLGAGETVEFRLLSARQWQTVMNRLGETVRSTRR